MHRAENSIKVSNYFIDKNGRKVYYIDIGTCPPKKAAKYVEELLKNYNMKELFR